MKKYYSGVGARKTPKEILHVMCRLGYVLADMGMILRSGGALGADRYFQMGCEQWCKDNNVSFDQRQIIIVPWDGFNGNHICANNGITTKNHWLADEITLEHHPKPDKLTKSALKLMTRNTTQVYGYGNGEESEFVVCWTPDGAVKETGINSGGTGQAIRLANSSNIPVINLQKNKHLKKILKWVEANEL